MEPTFHVAFIFLAMFSVAAGVVSAWGTWKVYQQRAPRLFRFPLALCALTFACSVASVSWSISKLAEPRHFENAGKVWLPMAVIAITLPDQNSDGLLDEVTRFAEERNAEIKNLPKPEGQRVDFSIQIAPESFFKVYNLDSSRRFNVAAYSHDEPSAWIRDWKVLVDRLTARFGKEQIKVTQAPPN